MTGRVPRSDFDWREVSVCLLALMVWPRAPSDVYPSTGQDTSRWRSLVLSFFRQWAQGDDDRADYVGDDGGHYSRGQTYENQAQPYQRGIDPI